MPKIVRFQKIGGPEVLKIEEVPPAEPGAGEVRIKVQALGLNRAESMFYRGQYIYAPKLPSGLGYEAAGVVEAAGPGVDRSWVGKQVSTVPAFSMLDYSILGDEIIAPVSALAEYPAKLSPEEGAAIWMQYITAYGALIEFGHLKKDDFIVITAASSSVGLAAIEIAKAEGATVIATTRTSHKKQEVLGHGADHVIATAEEDLAARVHEITAGKGARILFDPISGPFLAKLAEAAAIYGIIFEYGALSTEPAVYPIVTAISKLLTIRGYTLMEITRNPEKLPAATKYIHDRLEDGRFHPKIARTFPFEQIIEAYRYMESNAQIGKIVVTVP